MIPRYAILVVLAFTMLTHISCGLVGIGVKPRERREVPPDTPIALHPTASELRGNKLEQVLVQTDKTVEKVSLDSQTIRRLSEKMKPAVLSIYIRTTAPYKFQWFPLFPIPGTSVPFNLPGEALGSGFFIHPSGYLLSNNHVVEGAKKIVGRTRDGKNYDLLVVARDPVLDLALLRVVTPDREFEVIPMGKSGDIGVGDLVIAVGNPLGLGHTVTQGIISQTGRNLQKMDPVDDGRQIIFLQTDTAINPGSSGGPLITLSGAWIGVNTAVLMGTQGISFSVPSSQVKEFLESVLAGNGETLSK